MLEVIGSNYLYVAVGAIVFFMAAVAFVSVTDREPQAANDD